RKYSLKTSSRQILKSLLLKAVTTSAVSFIQTLRIELTCEERSDAYTLHNQLSSISHARLFQAIDEVINRCLPQGLSL
ncbi:hypothetical protein ABTK35_20525, partial [Acinetobacter baumannii]